MPLVAIVRYLIWLANVQRYIVQVLWVQTKEPPKAAANHFLLIRKIMLRDGSVVSYGVLYIILQLEYIKVSS